MIYDITNETWSTETMTSNSQDGARTTYQSIQSSTSSQMSTNTSNISTNTSNINTNTKNINNLGKGVAGATALTAALTSLPQAAIDSPFSCGVGSGAYSGRYAVGFGCASKVSERMDLNAGGSIVGGGSKDYGDGTLDSTALRAGFVFKLGKIHKPTLISMKEKEKLQSKMEILLASNTSIKNENTDLKARVEKLERIALAQKQNKNSSFNLSSLFLNLRSFLISMK